MTRYLIIMITTMNFHSYNFYRRPVLVSIWLMYKAGKAAVVLYQLCCIITN